MYSFMYSYQDCYKILSISHDSDWPEIRKAYKQLIQKWHPDRIDDPVRKISAEDKLKELNLAYEQLSAYYKKHGQLPALEPFEQTARVEPETKPAHTPAQPESAPKDRPGRRSNTTDQPHRATPRKSNTLLSLLIFTIFAFSIYTVVDIEEPTNHDTRQSSERHSDTSWQENKSGKKESASDIDPGTEPVTDQMGSTTVEKEQVEPENEYFTVGSSIGEVLRIQGPPDAVVNDTWFYGESYIEFENGVVKDWKRTAAYPIKAHMEL